MKNKFLILIFSVFAATSVEAKVSISCSLPNFLNGSDIKFVADFTDLNKIENIVLYDNGRINLLYSVGGKGERPVLNSATGWPVLNSHPQFPNFIAKGLNRFYVGIWLTPYMLDMNLVLPKGIVGMNASIHTFVGYLEYRADDTYKRPDQAYLPIKGHAGGSIEAMACDVIRKPNSK